MHFDFYGDVTLFLTNVYLPLLSETAPNVGPPPHGRRLRAEFGRTKKFCGPISRTK